MTLTVVIHKKDDLFDRRSEVVTFASWSEYHAIINQIEKSLQSNESYFTR